MKRFLIAMLIGCNLISIPVYAQTLSKVEAECVNIKSEEDIFFTRAQNIIKNMENKLTNVPITGDLDIDYLNQMIALHDEEIQLSLIIQSYISNPQVIELASDIVDYENGELREMRILRNELGKNIKKNPEKEKAYIDEYNATIQKTFKELKDYKESGNIAKDYLNLIAINNKTGIELSNSLLKSSQNDTVKKIAQNIIKTKGEQITEINRILPALK